MKKESIIVALIILVVLGIATFLALKDYYGHQDPEAVSIGAILPLTGDAAWYGNSLKKGLDVALDGYDVKLIYEDSKGEPKTAVSAVNKLVDVDRVEILVGDMFSNTTMAIMPIASKNGILLLTPTASSSEISEKGETTFRLYPSETEEGGQLFSFSNAFLPDKKGTVIVVNEDAMLKVAKIINQNDDKQIIEYTNGLVDFTPIIQKIDKNTEVVFLIGYFEENVRLIKRSIEMKKDYTFIGLSTLYSPQLSASLGNIKTPLYLSAPKSSLDTTNLYTADFILKYRSAYDEDPDIWAGYGYDTGNILLKVIKDAKEKGTGYVDEMYNIKDFDGATGVTTINKDRSIDKSMDMVEYADGEFKTVTY